MTLVETDPVPPGWPQTGHEIGTRQYGPFGREALALYAAASGDDNPLHLDPNAARAAGFASPPVHGMLMFSCFEPFIKSWRPDVFVARLSGKFLRPVLAGESLSISGRVVQRRDSPRPELTLRLLGRAPNGDLAILSEAAVRYKIPDRPG